MSKPSIIIIDGDSQEGREIVALGEAIQRARDSGTSPATIDAAAELLRTVQYAESSLSTYAKTGAFTPGQPSVWLLNQLRLAIATATRA